MAKKHMQSDNNKHTKTENRTDIYNPAFTSFVKEADAVKEGFDNNIQKWVEVVSYCRWFPDLWYDLITPPTGTKIRLDLDQRVFLRCLSRFMSTYAVLPRGYGKTLLEILSMYHTAIFYPDINISMTAQTKENAVKIMKDKHLEIIKYYPIINDEIVSASFSKDSAEVVFRSGSRVDILANAQSSKGTRRHRINIEEAALLNKQLYDDVLEPVPNVPRRLLGTGEINPYELNGATNFLTTSGFRGTDEFQRSLQMVEDMIALKGKMVLGASWELAVKFGRGETRAQLLSKKDTLSPINFANNYESKWVGASDGALVDIQKVMDLRTLSTAELVGNDKDEYVISMDIARSDSNSNNKSSIKVIKIQRKKNGNIIRAQVVNIISVPNGLNFFMQTVWLKRTRKKYPNTRRVVIDGNVIGKGILDECLKDTIDPITKESLGCWKTVNTEAEPESEDAEEILYDLHSQGINTQIIVNFMDYVESGKLELLEKRTDSNYSLDDKEYVEKEVIPFTQTDLLLEEVANLKIKHLSHGNMTVEQVTKRIDKDRYSALAYGLYVIKNELDENNVETEEDATEWQLIN